MKFGSPKTLRLVAILPEPPQAPQAQKPVAAHRWHRRFSGSGLGFRYGRSISNMAMGGTASIAVSATFLDTYVENTAETWQACDRVARCYAAAPPTVRPPIRSVG